MNETLKRYLISSGVTFVSTFLLVVATDLSVEGLTIGAVAGLLLAATRAGIKAVAELLSQQL